MTIKYRTTVNDSDKSPYFCVKYGNATIVFRNETEAFAAFKALSAAIGGTAYFTYSSEKCDSYCIYDVVRHQDISLEKKLFILECDVDPDLGHCVVREIPTVKCDNSGCWHQEDCTEYGAIPDGWQEIDDKHYCKEHHQ